MSIYMSRAELEEISEGLITAYANKFSNRVIQSIDIEHFITEFLMLRIEYASFAEDDAGRIGFLADGATPLLVHQDGKIIPFVFPKDTIVLDKFLLAEKEQGRRRFTMAHEASHHILSKMYAMPSEGRFHTEYDSERSYSKEELAQMFASVEWQADTMGASLLMPRRIIENALAKYNQSNPIKVYGDNTITSKEKAVIRRMAAYIGVTLFGVCICPPSQNKATLSPVVLNASKRQIGFFIKSLSVSSDNPRAMQAPTRASKSSEYVVPIAKSSLYLSGGART